MSEQPRQSRSASTAAVLAALIAVFALSGCRGGFRPFERFRPVSTDPNELMARWTEAGRIADHDAAMQRASGLVLGPDGWSSSKTPRADDPRTIELREAQNLFLEGDLDAAEKAFRRIARRESREPLFLFADADGLEDFDRRHSPWGMKALYYLGEIQFRKGNYVKAHDTFERLLKDYPGTPDFDAAVAREYQIAQIWLNQVHPPEGHEPLPWHARFQGGLPLIDTGGHAVAALEHVRQNDPTGPLADDAIKEIGDYFHRVGNYERAAESYDQLVTDHPKSPLLHTALLGSVDAKVNEYIGPEYDFTGLEEARQTARRALRLFPERLASTSDEIYHTLDLIKDQEAERAFKYGQYYQSAGYVTSAEYYYGMITQKWPKSEWAERARAELAELAKMPRKPSEPIRSHIRPGQSDPFDSGISPANVNAIGPGSLGP